MSKFNQTHTLLQIDYVFTLRKIYKVNLHQIVIYRGKSGMKINKILNQEVYVEDEKIGQVKDVYVDAENWEVTHFEIQLTKDAAREILGAKVSIRNSLSISALGQGSDWRTDKGIKLEVSKAQLHIYLRPPE